MSTLAGLIVAKNAKLHQKNAEQQHQTLNMSVEKTHRKLTGNSPISQRILIGVFLDAYA